MEQNIKNKNFVFPQPTIEELKKKQKDFFDYLKKNNAVEIPLNEAILKEGLQIKNSLEITSNNYHKKGVGENDILIIATAKLNNHILITEEGYQKNSPQQKRKFKIPLVCQNIGVQWKHFRQIL